MKTKEEIDRQSWGLINQHAALIKVRHTIQQRLDSIQQELNELDAEGKAIEAQTAHER